MRSDLSKEEIIDLLENVLMTDISEPSKQKDNIQYCCTVHGESNPSAGISIDKQLYHCFSCHSRGTIPWLVFKSMDSIKSVKQAEEFLQERYDVDFKEFDEKAVSEIKRYEELLEDQAKPKERFELPLFKIAPFKSGKETFNYFFERGFSPAMVKKFRVGRDMQNLTVTFPLFWEDGKLAGIIGRYIDPNRPKNQRYKIYSCPTGSIVFGLYNFEPIDDTVILVEGITDVIWLHQHGYTNALAILTNFLSKEQANLIKGKAKNLIEMYDNDSMGDLARESTRRQLKDSFEYYLVEYPEGKSDPQNCTKEELDCMIQGKRHILRKSIPRL